MSTPKQCLDDLAIFRGARAFDAPLHVGRPNIGDRERLLQRINEMLDRRWLTNNGPFVQEFEQKIAALVGARHCVAVCNGTVALEIAIRAAGLTGEVIVPSFTFIATAHAIQWQGITPVFCDIDPSTHNIAPDKIERLVTPRTTGIIGVHVWGRPCVVEELTEIADRHNLTLMFDAAHALGCSHNGRMIGSFGLAEVFSFHATKFVNTFEGGAVVTNNDELAGKVRLMKNFGFAGYDNVIHMGTNGKMTEIAAAMGLTSLESMEEFISVNRQNYHAYQQGLYRLPGIRLVEYDQAERCNYQYVVLEIDASVTRVTRDQFVTILQAENILARRYFFPGCHRMEPYRSSFPHASPLLTETERVANRVLVLPTGTAVGPAEIEAICGILRVVLENANKIREMLAHLSNKRSVAP